MTCDRCGAEVPANGRFCPHCGHVLAVRAPAADTFRGAPRPPEAARSSAAAAATAATAAVEPEPDAETAPPARVATAQRRREDRPVMVRLADYGKTEAPPPRMLITTQQVVLAVVSLVIVAVILGAAFLFYGPQARSNWNQTKCIDVRTGC